MIKAAQCLASKDPAIVLREGIALAVVCSAILAGLCLPGLA